MQPSDFLLMIDEPAAALSDPELKQSAGAALIFSVGAALLAFSPRKFRQREQAGHVHHGL
jgi:hypothetical protein